MPSRHLQHILLLLSFVLAIEPGFAQPTPSDSEQLQARIDAAAEAPPPAPYPVQRGLTAAMRGEASKASDASRMQVWAGQSARLARAEPAGQVLREIWEGARNLLGWSASAL